MKATIITFHCTPNYGATLQCVAMFKLFSQYFDQVELLDYRPKKITKNYNYIYWKRLRGFVASLLNVPTNLIKYRRFSKYLKQEVNLSPKTFYNANDISIKTDCVVLGSDQIWNIDIVGFDDLTYFGIINDEHYPTIAYAASIGNDKVSEAEKNVYKDVVSKMNSIGVREVKAKEILIDAGVKNEIEVVLDPTLLIPCSEWRHHEKEITGLPLKYVLVYSLLGYEETYRTAEIISKEKGLPIIEILGRNIDWLDTHKHTKIATAGPREFIYAIDKASYVVTDSFHGTAFSIIFSKKFLVIPHKTRGSRMIELLEKFDLQRCIIHNVETLNIENVDNIKFNKSLIKKTVEESLRFITNSVEKLKNDKSS